MNSLDPNPSEQFVIDVLITTLGECEAQITAACTPPLIDMTQIDFCVPVVNGFTAEVEKCSNLTRDPVTACECWESDTLAEFAEGLKGCVIKPIEANVTVTFLECKAAVSTCNNAQIEAIPVLVNCSNPTTDLVAQAETVANNIAALEGAKTAVEGRWYGKRRVKRAAATTCTEFIALVDAREFSNQSPKLYS